MTSGPPVGRFCDMRPGHPTWGMFLPPCLTAWRKIAHICVSDAVTTVCVFVQSELSPEDTGFKGRSLQKKELPLQAGGPGRCRGSPKSFTRELRVVFRDGPEAPLGPDSLQGRRGLWGFPGPPSVAGVLPTWPSVRASGPHPLLTECQLCWTSSAKKRGTDLETLKTPVPRGLETEPGREQAAVGFGQQVQRPCLMRSACPAASGAWALRARRPRELWGSGFTPWHFCFQSIIGRFRTSPQQQASPFQDVLSSRSGMRGGSERQLITDAATRTPSPPLSVHTGSPGAKVRGLAGPLCSVLWAGHSFLSVSPAAPEPGLTEMDSPEA